MKMKRSSFLRVVYFPCLAALLVTVFLLTFSVKVFAASGSSSKLPIYVENIDVTPYQNYINSNYGGFWNLSQDYVIGWGTQENGYFVQTFAIPQVPDQVQSYLFFSPSNLSSVYPDFDYVNNTLTLTFTNLANNNYQPYRLIYFYSNGVGPQTPYAANFNNASSVNKGVYGNTGAQLNYVSSTIYLTNNNGWDSGKAVFVNELPPEDPNYDIDVTGHAKPYDPLEIPSAVIGHSLPQLAKKPWTWNSYNWTTYNPPAFDSSSITNALDSINNRLGYNYEYLRDNLSGSLSNLGSNIVNAIGNVQSDLQYYGGLIVNGINNGIKTFYNNMVSLLEPITVPFLTIVAMGTDPETGLFSVPYLTQVLLVPDAVNVVDLIVANDEFDLIESGKTIVTTFPLIIHQLTSVSPSPVFHVPSCYYHGKQIGDFDISFAWFNNYKVYYDILINGFLIIGYIYWLFVSFSSHMRGVFLPEQSDDAYQRHNIGF